MLIDDVSDIILPAVKAVAGRQPTPHMKPYACLTHFAYASYELTHTCLLHVQKC